MKNRILFKPPTRDWSAGRVILNWTNDPIVDLETIADSYHSIAKRSVEQLKAQPVLLRTSGSFDAYPVVFLYRQAFELMLKAIVFAGAVILRNEGKEPMPLKRIMKHELTPLFSEMCRVFALMASDDSGIWDFGVPELATRDDFESLVREFDAVDAGSYAFRYSIKTDGTTPNLDREFAFDLFAFAATMDRIIPVLSAAPEWIRESAHDYWAGAYEDQVQEWQRAASSTDDSE